MNKSVITGRLILGEGGNGMKIHEFQAKEILKSYGVPVPKGGMAESPEDA